MGNDKRDWHVPSDWKFIGLTQFLVPTMMVLAAILLPVLSNLKTADFVPLYWSGFYVAGLGVLLLFFARLPLYRQRKFFTFGPKALPVFHRKLYWVAYSLVALAVLQFLMFWSLAK